MTTDERWGGADRWSAFVRWCSEEHARQQERAREQRFLAHCKARREHLRGLGFPVVMLHDRLDTFERSR